jgi:hypothetical protein
LAVPINLVNNSGSSTTTIDGLLKLGQFTPPLASTESVLSGVLARTVNKKTDPPQPIDERIEFSRANAQGALLLTWLPKEKRKGYPSLRFYDLDNNLISETVNKKKISLCRASSRIRCGSLISQRCNLEFTGATFCLTAILSGAHSSGWWNDRRSGDLLSVGTADVTIRINLRMMFQSYR